MRVGRQPYVPAEDQEEQPLSPVEMMLAQAEPEFFEVETVAEDDEEVVHRPWEPTGEETPKRTVEAAIDLDKSPPPPETAGGSIPSAFARFRQYEPGRIVIPLATI